MKTGLFVGGALVALAVAGCSNSQPSTPPTASTTTINTPPAATTTTTTANGTAATTTTSPGGINTKINNNAGPGTSNGTDQATADAVNAAIVHNKEMTGSRVDAVVTNGVARLTGTVQNQQQKALAATTASKTSGVTSVVNKLIIDATGGIHSAHATPKVINHTTVINHYIAVPGSGGTSGQGTGSGNASGTNSGSGSASGNGSAATGSGAANGASSSAAGGNGASASSTSGGATNSTSSGTNGNGGNP